MLGQKERKEEARSKHKNVEKLLKKEREKLNAEIQLKKNLSKLRHEVESSEKDFMPEEEDYFSANIFPNADENPNNIISILA